MSIAIYKSLNNGFGGPLDTTSNRDIFTEYFENQMYCCLYIKNESNTSKNILSVYLTSIDNINMGLLVDNDNEPRFNTLSEITDVNSINFISDLYFRSLTLEPNTFITVWLVLPNTYDNVSKRNVNITVDYVDEY